MDGQCQTGMQWIGGSATQNSIYIIWCYGREGATKYHDSLYLNPTPPGISVADI